MADTLPIGVIGLGNIGQLHTRLLREGRIEGASLAAVCSRAPVELGVPHFTDYRTLLASGLVDAVLIATPTASHLEMGLAACEQGVHLLMEKPLGMTLSAAQQLVAASPKDMCFGVMLNQRFDPQYAKIKALLDENALGQLTRIAWVMTAWYRPDIYYQVSEWRGTWPGEGGGLLINQCIHNLDVLQWWVGLPEELYAMVGFGARHDIDVEDEVTAVMHFAHGLTGTLIASTGEAPGMNQLDIIGDRGSLRLDDNGFTFKQADQSVSEHLATSRDMFGVPDFTPTELTVGEPVNQHAAVLQNFVQACAGEAALATPAEAGLASIELANAILLSGWQQQPLRLPLNTRVFDQQLAARIAQSSLRVPREVDVKIDMDASFR